MQRRLLPAALIGFTLLALGCGGDRPSAPPPKPPVQPAVNSTSKGLLTVEPDPVQICDGSGLGVATLRWKAERDDAYEVRAGSANGTLFAKFGITGQATTGKWARDGLTFYALDHEGAVVATAVVRTTTEGCR